MTKAHVLCITQQFYRSYRDHHSCHRRIRLIDSIAIVIGAHAVIDVIGIDVSVSNLIVTTRVPVAIVIATALAVGMAIATTIAVVIVVILVIVSVILAIAVIGCFFATVIGNRVVFNVKVSSRCARATVIEQQATGNRRQVIYKLQQQLPSRGQCWQASVDTQ